MPLPTKTFDQFVADFLAAYSNEIDEPVNFTEGDPILALSESCASQADFLQVQCEYTVAFARAQTSTGVNLDSFMAQFGFTRVGATYATGSVTMSLASPAINTVNIPPGVVVQTLGGAIKYTVVADSGQPAFNTSTQTYQILPGQQSISVTVQAVVAGSGSNVLANQLVQFGTSGYGATTVTNPVAIASGENAQSDAAFRASFVKFINNLSKATKGAIELAIETAAPGLTYALLNNTTQALKYEPGFFTVVLSNPGQPVTSEQIAAVYAAVDAVKAFTVQFAVIAATVIKPLVSFNIQVSNILALHEIETAVQTAVVEYINLLPVGAPLYLTNLIAIAEGADPRVVSVQFTSVSVNNKQADFKVSPLQVIEADQYSVAIGTYNG